MALALEHFEQAHQEDRVIRKDHGPLSIFCYSAQTAYNKEWCEVTRSARGIIWDTEERSLVALPFPKFFNLGEMPETQPEALPARRFWVEEKIDGSLCIIYHWRGQWRVATKGSLDSEQARYAQTHLLPAYDLSEVPTNLTILAEVIYPENRIVVDYGDTRELVLISARDRETGYELGPTERDELAEMMSMPVVETHLYDNILNLPFSSNQEGYVVRWECGTRVKIKSPEYIKIHRILHNLSPRRVLEALESGEMEHMRAQVPDELAGDLDDLIATLRMAVRQKIEAAQQAYAHLKHLAGSRKDFAIAAKQSAPSELLGMLFSLLDGRDITPLAYKAVRAGLKEHRNGTE